MDLNKPEIPDIIDADMEGVKESAVNWVKKRSKNHKSFVFKILPGLLVVVLAFLLCLSYKSQKEMQKQMDFQADLITAMQNESPPRIKFSWRKWRSSYFQ